MAVAAEARRTARLDDHQIEARGQPRDSLSARHDAHIAKARQRFTKDHTLSVRDRLFGEPEFAACAVAHFNDHEFTRRAGIDREDVELCAANAEVSGQDRPSEAGQPIGDERLRRVTGELS